MFSFICSLLDLKDAMKMFYINITYKMKEKKNNDLTKL